MPLFRLPYKAVLTEITVPTLQRNFAKLCSHVDMLLSPLGADKHKKKQCKMRTMAIRFLMTFHSDKPLQVRFNLSFYLSFTAGGIAKSPTTSKSSCRIAGPLSPLAIIRCV